MNVENRKLFTNRDARAKLATMGGIMGSSPELLGEVQKFAEAGEVKAPMFLVQGVKGYSGNQFLQLTAAELDLLNRSIGPLDVQEATPEILSQINPMQLSTTDNPNVKRLFADIGIELPQAPAPIEEQGSGVVDDRNTLQGILGTLTPVPYVAKALGFDNAADTLGYPPRFKEQDQNNIVPSVSAGEQLLEQKQTMASTDYSNLQPFELARLADQGDDQAINQIRLNEISAEQDQEFLGTGLLGTDAITSETLSSIPADRLTSETSSAKSNLDRITKNITTSEEFLKANPSNRQVVTQLETLKAELPAAKKIVTEALEKETTLENILLSPGVGGPGVTSNAINEAMKTAQEFRDEEEALVEAQGGLNSMSLEDSKDIRSQRAADSTTRMSEQGPNFVFDPEKIKKEIDEGGSGSNSIIGDATGTNQDLSPKDSVKAFQAMYKEMLGMDDEDKEKEKWHQMAMIGFAIAAGQDPNALSNIAGGLLEGTKMMKSDRTRKQDRDDKITMMAIQSAEADRRDRMAEERAIRAEGRKTTTAEGVATTSYERARITAKELAAANIQKEIAKSQSSGQKMSPLEPFSDQVAILGKELLASGQVTDLSVALQLAADAYKPYYVGQSTVNTTGSTLTDEDQVKKLKDAGKSDLEIRKMLIDANKDPTKFGL